MTIEKKYLYFSVRVPVTEGLSHADWRAYIEDAVKSWAGQFEPVGGGYGDSIGHPLGPPCEWNEQVKVQRQYRA